MIKKGLMLVLFGLLVAGVVQFTENKDIASKNNSKAILLAGDGGV